MAARLYSGLINLASDPVRGTDYMKVIQHIAGVLSETYMVFDEPDQAMESSFSMLRDLLGCEPLSGLVTRAALPPAHVMDSEIERGRFAARMFFEEWLDCKFEFHKLKKPPNSRQKAQTKLINEKAIFYPYRILFL